MTCRLAIVYFTLSLTAFLTSNSNGASVRRIAASPFCGVRCIYVAARAEGLPVQFESLLDEKFVGTVRGSNEMELSQAASAVGLNSLVVQNANLDALRLSKLQAILHVRSGASGIDYDHFILVSTSCAGHLIFMDGNGQTSLANAEDINSIWGGDAIILSSKPFTTTQVFLFRYLWTIKFYLFTVSFVTAAVLLSRRVGVLANCRSISRQVIFLFVASILVSLFREVVISDSLLAQSDTRRQVCEGSSDLFLDRVDFPEAKALLRHSIFIDARFQSDFAAGHIAGALSYPVSTAVSSIEIPAAVRSLPRERPVIVYCQDRTCTFANAVARKLLTSGFRDVKLFTGGWNDWLQNGGDVTSND